MNDIADPRTEPKSLPATADVVIIGAGIAGVMTAHQLLHLDPDLRVLIIERSHVASGSTSHSAACFRAQFTRQFNVEISLLSRKLYKNEIADIIGAEPLVESGYLFLQETEDQLVEALYRAEQQSIWGVPVDVMSAGEIKERFSYIDSSRVVGGTFCQFDGFIKDPASITQAVAEHLEGRGVTLCTKTTVFMTSIERDLSFRVQTSKGDVRAKVVIICAGAWSGPLASHLGTYLPVAPVPRQLTFTAPFYGIDGTSCPMTITPCGAYLRPNGNHFFLGYAPRETKSSYRAIYDEELAWRTVEMVANYIPVLENAEIKDGDCGLYEVSPDHNAIIGEDPHVRNLFYCTGFSGHGVMHSPGAARLLSELIVHGRVRSISPEMYRGVCPERLYTEEYEAEYAVI
jgi:sarcosine oxidase, subunit beta